MFKSFACLFILTNIVLSSEIYAHKQVERNKSAGRIIFVTGSCSSGKSSMAKIIAQKLNAKSFAFDEYVMPIVLKKFIKKHYGNFWAFFINKFIMRNFFTSVSFLSEKKKYELQKNFYNDLKDGMAIEPTSKMYKEVRNLALQGHDVVVESPLYLWDGVDCLSSLAELNGAAVTYVLTYCPWNDLVSRIKKRNSSTNKKNHRELDWALINFMHCFEISPNNHGQNFLECLNGDNVYRTVIKYSQPRYKKKRMCLLSETKKFASQKFTKNDTYFIYPRFNYNITVNTKTHSPEQGAEVVMNHIVKRRIRPIFYNSSQNQLEV